MRVVGLIVIMLFGWASFQAPPAVRQRPVEYSGTCDASAAVPLDDATFVVANDEDNVLRVYRRGQASVLSKFDVSKFLEVDPNEPESDIEAATRVGDVIYWITSHGRNKNAKERPSRYRFFATKVKGSQGGPALEPTGKPYKNLLRDMLANTKLSALGLQSASTKAPESEGGLNIEGLTRRPDGSLLIGFRNPLPGAKAILIPLENPADLIAGKPARLGAPLVLDLGGLGVRSLEFVEGTGQYLIAAGPTGDGGSFRIFEWTGRAADKPTPITAWTADIASLSPEALIVYPRGRGNSNRIDILSDDGGLLVGGQECKSLKNEDQKKFRGVQETRP